jgi:multisubunit Na+/H+ antiporter MnhE subunit
MNLAEYQIRDKESFAYAKEITKPWGGIDRVIAWCKTEMQNDWRWQVIDTSSDLRPGRYIFFFDSDKDCCAFTLKWQ